MTSSGLINEELVNRVCVESRRDIELYIKAEVNKINVSNRFKKVISKLCQESFDIGFEMAKHDKVEVRISNG